MDFSLNVSTIGVAGLELVWISETHTRRDPNRITKGFKAIQGDGDCGHGEKERRLTKIVRLFFFG